MKFLIASDLHGSKKYTQKLIDVFNAEKGDYLVLLGDLYYHGPRNALPDEYDAMAVAKMLNDLNKKLIVIKGNCDSVVDQMISNFDFNESVVLISGGKSVFLTHGHIYNIENKPKTVYDVVIYGHLHTGFIEKENGVIFANTGSVSLPKNNTQNSYIILEDGKITLKTLENNIVATQII